MWQWGRLNSRYIPDRQFEQTAVQPVIPAMNQQPSGIGNSVLVAVLARNAHYKLILRSVILVIRRNVKLIVLHIKLHIAMRLQMGAKTSRSIIEHPVILQAAQRDKP